MNRCTPSLLALALACSGVLAALAPATAAAQTAAVQRKFTKYTLRGKIEFGATPAIKLDGRDTQMPPGSRIHDQRNLLVRPSRLVGTTHDVDYTLDLQGRVHEVWILTAAEIENKPWPKTPAEAAAWTFDASSQTWTKP